MKTLLSIAIFLFASLNLNVLSAQAQGNQIQTYEGTVILPSTYGDLICMGNWNNDLGRCDGPAVSSGALAAISAAKSADKLEQIRLLLDKINNGLSANTQALLALQKSLDPQNRPAKESLDEAIAARFAALPAGILSDDSVRKEIEQLKKEILLEVSKRNQKMPSSSGE